MNPKPKDTQASRGTLMDWLVRVNAQVGDWAASMSWWRLIVLFLLILVAGSLIGELLHLKHDRVRVAKSGDGESVVVNIGGEDGIRITRGAKNEIQIGGGSTPDATDATPTDASPPSVVKPPAPPKAPRGPGARKDSIELDESDIEEIEEALGGRKVLTFRGVLGDIAGAIMVILFAYLAAAKIVTRKVAQADEKVRSAVDAAEHEAMERQLVQARLQVLQAQVEPHFLFNTLAAIDYLIETDPKRGSQMQKALITYLRGALPQMRQESSTLGRELRLIRSFLDLLKMRMEDRLEVEFAVPEGAESAEFPPMMLQSLVENAIKHGIEPKPEGGKVTVAARIQNGQLWVEVRDTGVGMVDSVDRLDGPTSGTGIGLQNIRERLAMLYPGKGRLTLVSSDDGSGTVVRIGIPYQVGPEAKPVPGNAQPQGGAA
jgi:signal transduction histidine kinase